MTGPYSKLIAFVDAVQGASPPELREMAKLCKANADDFEIATSRRPIWRDLAALLRKEAKR